MFVVFVVGFFVCNFSLGVFMLLLFICYIMLFLRGDLTAGSHDYFHNTVRAYIPIK